MSVCQHLKQAHILKADRHVCEECVKMGASWLHLRLCMDCGHIGCCDSSPNKHATKHFNQVKHPIIRSIEPGEEWAWCYVDKQLFDISRGLEKAKQLD